MANRFAATHRDGYFLHLPLAGHQHWRSLWYGHPHRSGDCGRRVGRTAGTFRQILDKTDSACRGSHCGDSHRILAAAGGSQLLCRRTGRSRLRQHGQLDCGQRDAVGLSALPGVCQGIPAVVVGTHGPHRGLYPRSFHGYD